MQSFPALVLAEDRADSKVITRQVDVAPMRSRRIALERRIISMTATDQSDVTSTDATRLLARTPYWDHQSGPLARCFGLISSSEEYTTAGFIGEAIAGAILILVAAACWTIAVKRSLVAP